MSLKTKNSSKRNQELAGIEANTHQFLLSYDRDGAGPEDDKLYEEIKKLIGDGVILDNKTETAIAFESLLDITEWESQLNTSISLKSAQYILVEIKNDGIISKGGLKKKKKYSK